MDGVEHMQTLSLGAQAADDDDEFFDAFNLPPDPYVGHEPIPELHGAPPTFSAHAMFWKATVPQSGLVPFIVGSDDRANIADYYGLTVDQIQSPGGAKGPTGKLIEARRVDNFKIAYTIARPADLTDDHRLEDLPLIGLMAGVPANRRWKYSLMRELAKFAVVVVIDMLGMGESDQVLEKNFLGATDLRAWDWEHDVEYVHKLMTSDVPRVMHWTTKKKWIFATDDWAGGIGLRYLAAHGNEFLEHAFFINPVWLDGYPVIEISAIGQLAALRKFDSEQFHLKLASLPQAIIGIEKYMVTERWKMNRYTEPDQLFPYVDLNWQQGLDAAHMLPNYWNLAVLAERSSRLAPRQLQPYSARKNPHGVRVRNIRTPVTMIWGMKDQMMPPAQVFRSAYLFPNAPYTYVEVPDGNHFLEADQPHTVVRAMLNELLRNPETRGRMPIFLGNGPYVMKGDEAELKKRLEAIYGAPKK